ncbi:putative Ancient ubiquitous protein 1 [Paratrimastix pyriformis]|uniref:Ancient ubiquitous protein 1 n=1 Tax=Paratrimastix pyriformis TaxID=342808 RepID=A0ABQ8U8M9_9EUKA|nr:putative Ancient ubiquitous protein 1 [Paratrimastix pyriformis]
MALRGDIVDPLKDKLILEDLFSHTRLRRPLTIKHLFFFLYFPFGVVLLGIRLLFLVFAELLLFPLFRMLRMNTFFYKIYARMLGVFVVVKGKENWSKNLQVLVSNHRSEFDIIALRSLLPVAAVSPLFYKTFIFTRKMVKEINPIFIDYSNREVIHKNIDEHLTGPASKVPILCFPEGALTNGEQALLLYHKHLFSLERPIQPLANSVSGPFHNVVNVHHLCTKISHNIFWLLLMPYHVWTVNVLPEQRREPTETAEQFANRIQSMTAAHLGLIPSTFSVRDKAILLRRWTALREGQRFLLGRKHALAAQSAILKQQTQAFSTVDGLASPSPSPSPAPIQTSPIAEHHAD